MDFDLSLLAGMKDKDYSRRGLMVLEGRIVIEKALAAKADIVGIVCSAQSEGDWLGALGALGAQGALGAGFPVLRPDHAELCDIVGFNFHHGALALARRPPVAPFDAAAAAATTIAAVARNTSAQGPSTDYLCLWNVTDPSNLGALIRSAAGLGAAGVLLGPGCADPYYRKTLRASMGNAFSLPLYSCDAATIAALAAAGFDTAAAALSRSAVPLGDFSARGPLVLIVGNEGFGIPAEIAALCRKTVKIPMANEVDSLNVVVAAGICMYELFGAKRAQKKTRRGKAGRKTDSGEAPRARVSGSRASA